MKPTTTLVLVGLLVALGAYIYFFELETGQSVVDDGSTVQIYGATYGEYDLVGLEIAGAQQTARFVRTNETLTQDWERLLPAPIPPEQLDQARVNGAATRLGRLTASQVITGVTDLAPYGLDTPELTVTLTISNSQKIILYTGAKTPVNDNRYIRTATAGQSVYLVFSLAVDDLRRLLDDPPLAPTPLPTITPTGSP